MGNALNDPLINRLLDSKASAYALISQIDGVLCLIAASKYYRHTIGFQAGPTLLLDRYGELVVEAMGAALAQGSGWTGHVQHEGGWHDIKMWKQGSVGVIEELPMQQIAPIATAIATGTTPLAPGMEQQENGEPVVLHVNDKGIVQTCSQSLARFLGQTQEQLKGLDASHLVFRTDVGQFKRLIDQVKYQTQCSEGSFRLRNMASEVIFYDWTVASDGSDILLVGRSSKQHLEAALLKSEERINSILESMNDAFFAIDLNGHISYLNAKGAELLGKPAHLLLGRLLWERAPHLKKTSLFRCLNQAKGGMQPETFQWQDPDNESWYQVKAYPSEELISIFFTDISSIKRSENKMRHQAMHDSLTGLPNRLALSQALDELLANNEVSNIKLGLLFIDLDGFKAVNDTLGHDCGDELLIAVSQRLKGVVRNSDIVARLSGDEFVITLPYIPNEEAAFHVGKKVVDAVSKRPFELGDKQIYVGASVGVALFPDDAQDAEGLLKHADIAMYQAKQAGKNTVRMFHTHMSTTLQTKVNLENELHHAISNDRIELHYQPRFNADGSICSVEALARLRGKHGAFIPPVDFIPIAEETGLIITLGEQVLRKACDWVVKTNSKLKTPIGISVNVSGIQLLDGKLCETVKKALHDSGLAPRLLELELTETVLMQNQEKVTADLHRLHSLGVSLSIDDFGTGYSSLAMLHKMPVQIIKLDRSFVSDLPNKQDSVIISRTVLAMAKALGLSVVAEGVETAEQRDFLIESGVMELQGFGLAKPMNSDDSRQFVLSQQLPGKAAGAVLGLATYAKTSRTPV